MPRRKLHSSLTLSLVLLAMTSSALHASQEPPAIRPVPFRAVKVDDAFWSPRLERNRDVTIPHSLKQCEETLRLANFEVAAKQREGGMVGYFFNDSDVYKWVEGAANALATRRDPRLEADCDRVIDRIAAAQEPDGYLYTSRTILDEKNLPPGGKERWSDMGSGHELYCAGHLYEAAVAYAEATGKHDLLDVALKNAELVFETFGPGKKPHPCGHPEIELALVKLHQHTGEEKWLELAKFFIDTRGHGENRELYGEYAQDHKPILEQESIVGHAVRAAYLLAGTTDVGRITGDTRYVDASRRLWDDMVTSQVYLTGGIGAMGSNEGFGDRFVLPNLSAYNETCASIASALWSFRLFLATAEARYMDLVERVIYNAFHSGWSLSGDRFFYPNPLESRGAERVPWFGCACCPPNINRFVPSIPGFAYATAKGALYVSLFIGGSADVDVGGQPVRVRQETGYPWDGRVKIFVEPEVSPREFTVLIRIPCWARGEPLPGGLYRFADSSQESARVSVNGEEVPIALEKGYVRMQRLWKKGDQVELELKMPPRLVQCDERVQADRGLVAVQRGPLVYCLEGIDQPVREVRALLLDTKTPMHAEAAAGRGPIDGMTILRGKARPVGRNLDGSLDEREAVDVVAVPYFAWANRGSTPMAVWLARTKETTRPLPAPTLAHTAKASASFGKDLWAISDQEDPASSGDHDHPFFHWWPHKGTLEWVMYEFTEPSRVSGVEVYWFDDTGRGECRVPKSWKLLARIEGQWRDVESPSGFGTDKDRDHRCTFTPVRAEALKLEIHSQEGWAGGIHEWRILSADTKSTDR